jgi:hypothetical protein
VRAAPAGALEAVSALLPAMEHELLGKLGVRPENRTAS